MQVIANQSGASQKRLRCHFSAVTEQKVTLKDQFLKHSDEYVLTVENCYTNASPNLFFRDAGLLLFPVTDHVDDDACLGSRSPALLTLSERTDEARYCSRHFGKFQLAEGARERRRHLLSDLFQLLAGCSL